MQYGILTFDDPIPDTSRKILHVDMDAFYASVEIRDHPSLKNKPVVIARHPNQTGGRGIVTTCNYVAREFGIHSAMSALEAYQRCKHAVFITPDHQKYKQVSLQIREIFSAYTDLIEPVSLDEAYLDITDNKKGINSATIIGKSIQNSIFQELNLTSSIGASYNKYIAKIASDYRKPFGMTVVEPDQAVTFLRSLDINRFPGVGRKTLALFHDLEIYTGNDLYEKPLDWLIKHFGKLGYSLYFRVRGISNSQVSKQRNRKSLGKESTFRNFLETEFEVSDQIRRLVEEIAQRHSIAALKAHTLTLKIRYEDFETVTRQSQQDKPIASIEESFEIAYKLWRENGTLERKIRLLGVTYSNFNNMDSSPISLF